MAMPGYLLESIGSLAVQLSVVAVIARLTLDRDSSLGDEARGLIGQAVRDAAAAAESAYSRTRQAAELSAVAAEADR